MMVRHESSRDPSPVGNSEKNTELYLLSLSLSFYLQNTELYVQGET